MLKIYTLEQRETWDTIVKSFKNYDVYYLSGYARTFELHGDGIPILLYYSEAGIRGINVVMKRDIAISPYFCGKLEEGYFFDIVTPYGYGGWIFEGETSIENVIDSFRESYLNWCYKNGIVSEFIRFHPMLENAFTINKELYQMVFLGNTVAIKLDDEKNIWEGFSSKNRGHIRKAIKEGVTVRRETDKEAFDVFQEIYESTMNHDKASSYYYFDSSFFDSIRNELYGNYMVFTAYLDEKPIASSIMLFANYFMSYHLSGQLFSYRKYAGTNIILYEAAKWGCANGYRQLHLGGGLGAQEGPLYTFKKSFNIREKDKWFYIGKKILMPKVYDNLVAMRQELPDNNFFPRYRA